MKHYLIRAGMSPFDELDATHVISHNSFGGNVGNLVYQYSVFRTLMTDDVTITPDYYSYDTNIKRVDEINGKYDGYILPLADAFREDFAPALRKYTKLIKKLKIPVYVIGAGLRAPFEPKLNESFPFDEDAKAFVSAVLEKSNIIGLRGKITSDYLSRLGFKEGTDHTVIGCPSMYTFGRELNIRKTNITKDSMICVNSSKLSQKSVLDFISRGLKEYPNHYFIPQWMKELVLSYVGAPPLSSASDNYPVKMSDDLYMNNRVRFFLNVPTWLDFLRQADLSFGARLHGNITATIAGTPSILIPKDARMRELTEYHGLTHVWWNDLTEETRLADLVEQVDFQSPTKKQAQNFDHFIDFLNKNELDHIYKNGQPKHVPLDEKIKEVNFVPPIHPISGCDMHEIAMRFESYYPMKTKRDEDKVKKLKNDLSKKDKQIKKQNVQIKHLKGTLNRKSVKMALKTANVFRSK